MDAKNKAAFYERITAQTTPTTEFKGLSLDDDSGEEEEETTEQFASSKNPTGIIGIATIPSKYFSSLLNGISLNKLQNSFGAPQNNITNKIIATSTTYFINPLVNAWNVARKNLSLNSPNPISERIKQEDEFSNGNMNRYASLPYQSSNKNNVGVVDDFTSNGNDDQDVEGDDDDSSNDENIKTRAKLAFRNAFYKYSNLMSKRYYNKTSTIEGGDGGGEDDDGVTTDIPMGKANLNNDTMEFNVDFPIEKIDENSNGDSEDDNIGDGDDDSGGNTDTGNVGIFVLEIFGTIAGLGWGAISQIQNIFTRN